jgi:hypothetical protein
LGGAWARFSGAPQTETVVPVESNNVRATSNADLTSDDTATLCQGRGQGAEGVPAERRKEKKMRTTFAVLLTIAGLITIGSAAGSSGVGPKVGPSPNPQAIAPPGIGGKGLPSGPPDFRPPIQQTPPIGAGKGRFQMPAPSPATKRSRLFEPAPGSPGGNPSFDALPEHMWDDEVRLTSDPAGGDDYLARPSGRTIAVGHDGRVHVVWYAYGWEEPSGYRVFYKRYNPGFGWSDDTVLYSAFLEPAPAIALDSNGTSVHVVWFDIAYVEGWSHIFHMRCDPSGDGNDGWVLPAEDVCTNHDQWQYSHITPSVTCSPGRVHVSWYNQNYNPWERSIGYRECINGIWQDQVTLDRTTDEGYGDRPSISANRNHDVVISWSGYSSSDYINHCFGDKRVGGIWTEGMLIERPDINAFSYAPVSCLDADGRWHVAWTGYVQEYGDELAKVRYRWQDIEDGIWSSIDTISPGGYPDGYGGAASIAASANGRVHVVWEGLQSIRYRLRTTDGVWQPIEDVSPYGDGYQRSNPSITPDKDNCVHVVWQDPRNNWYDIYYRRTILRPARDLACTRVITPSGVYVKGTTVYPEVGLYNNGVDAQSDFPVYVWIDAGGTRVHADTEFYPGTIGSGESAHFVLPKAFTVNYPLCRVTAFTDLSGDERRRNDTAFADCLAADFVQDFETYDGNLQASPASGGWAWGTPTGGYRLEPHSGTHVWGDVLSGSYRDYARDSLLMGPLKANVDNPVVGWWSWYAAEATYDGYALYFSTDNGSSWTMTHAVPGLARGYDYIIPCDYDSAYSGSGPDYTKWEQMFHRIPVPSGTRFWLMWMLRADYSYTYDGVMIDDVAGFGFEGPALDAAVAKILAPSGLVPLDPIAPKAVVGNFGTQAEPFDITFSINCDPPYQKTVNVTLPPLSVDTVEFPNWSPIDGYFTARCQTFLDGDEYPGNDRKTQDFIAAPFGWSARQNMPTLPSRRDEGAGGWLAYNSGDGLIYAAKGESTPDFYSFDPRTNTWTNLPPIPAGRENKLPGEGCRGVANGGDKIYMTKGNNTLGFWCYTISTQTWTQLSDVPAGRCNVQAGTDLVYVNYYGWYDMVFLLKGPDGEFCVCYPDWDYWYQLPDAPVGTDSNWAAGSWLVSDGDHGFYAHRALTQEMYRFDSWYYQWTALSGMPLISRYGGGKLPLGKGGCATWQDSAIYALKGSNTTQFWKYLPAGDAWTELDTMPGGHPPKRVHAGGDITATGDMLFAFKGSKTNELWRYVPYPVQSGGTGGGQEVEGVQFVPSFALKVSPNPMRLGGTIRYAVPAPANLSLKLYDITGAVARTVSSGKMQPGWHTEHISAKGLARGVYILKLQSDAGNLTRKVVIE